MYMVDGIYQSVMVFFIPYLLLNGGTFITFNGLNVEDRVRLGCYIAHPAVLTINMYILINTYRWDWIMLLVVTISDLFVFFWTGVYSSTTSSGVFYQSAPQVYAEATFWAVFFLTPVICLFPRFAAKAIQKVYFPYDVDIIREQDRQGKFTRLTKVESTGAVAKNGRTASASSDTSRKGKHAQYASVDEDTRPIYPPSVATHGTHNPRSQNGSDGTNYTGHRLSLDMPLPARPSIDRARPSYDRIRASMDRVRPSFEASSDFTSAARLSRIESSQSTGYNRFRRLRGLSLTKSAQI
jgi:phospholipid-translocating ATPase